MHDAREAFRTAILAVLGYAPEVIEPGRFQRFGTSDRRADSAGWCKLFEDIRGGVFGCYRQGVSETWSAAGRATMTREQRAALARQVMAATKEREAQQRQQWAENARRMAQVWAQCVPLVAGDPVTLYLKHRGLAGVWPLPEALRFHRGLAYWHGGEKLGTYPAMVAPLMAPDGRVVALHRTYLTRDGRKAPVPEVKKLTGAAGPLAGACIPLHKPSRCCIGIAEGIETALSASCASGVPTVAAYCAGNWQRGAGLQGYSASSSSPTTTRATPGKSLRKRCWAARCVPDSVPRCCCRPNPASIGVTFGRREIPMQGSAQHECRSQRPRPRTRRGRGPGDRPRRGHQPGPRGAGAIASG